MERGEYVRRALSLLENNVSELVKPADHLEIKFKGQVKELFFSFNRQNALLRHFPEPTASLTATIDPFDAELILRIMLVDKLKHLDEFEVEEGDLSNEDYEKILNWVADHLIHFFVSRFQQASQKAEALEPMMEKLAGFLSSKDGSED